MICKVLSSTENAIDMSGNWCYNDNSKILNSMVTEGVEKYGKTA